MEIERESKETSSEPQFKDAEKVIEGEEQEEEEAYDENDSEYEDVDEEEEIEEEQEQPPANSAPVQVGDLFD